MVTSKPGLLSCAASKWAWSCMFRAALGSNPSGRHSVVSGVIKYLLMTEGCSWDQTGPLDPLCSRMSSHAGCFSLLEGPSASLPVRSQSSKILMMDECSLGSCWELCTLAFFNWPYFFSWDTFRMLEFPVFSQQSLFVKSLTQLSIADFNRSSLSLQEIIFFGWRCVWGPQVGIVKHSKANETFYQCSFCLPEGQVPSKVNNPTSEYTFQLTQTYAY